MAALASGVQSVFGNVAGKATGASQFSGNGFNINQGDFQANGQEQDLTNALVARSNGTAPSVAQQQLTQGLDQSNSQANATAQAQRGVSPALAARLAAQGQSANDQATNQQGGQLRAQEQMTNDAQLQQELQSQRQGNMAYDQLGVSQQTGLNTVNQAGNAVATKQAGSLLSGIGGAMALAHGGEVPRFADGGMVQSPFTAASMGAQDNSYLSQFASALSAIAHPQVTDGGAASSMGKMPSMKPGGMGGASPYGTGGDPTSDAQILGGASTDAGSAGAVGGMGDIGAALMAANGAIVPGKAQVPGDSPKNDNVPAVLSPGEIVVPRSIAHLSPDDIAKFVAAVRSKNA